MKDLSFADAGEASLPWISDEAAGVGSRLVRGMIGRSTLHQQCQRVSVLSRAEDWKGFDLERGNAMRIGREVALEVERGEGERRRRRRRRRTCFGVWMKR